MRVCLSRRCVARRRMMEVKDGSPLGFISDLDLVENEVSPKQFFSLFCELRLEVDCEPVLLAQDDAVGEDLSLRREEVRRAAGARRELLDVVRDEAVAERSAILAGEDHGAPSSQVEEKGRASHGQD